MAFMTGGLIRVSEMMPLLPPSEKKIAAYIMEHPEEIISLTASELGKRSLTSSAAVVRLCKSLGLNGLQELKMRIAGDLQKTTESGFRDIAPNESPATIIDKMTSNSIQTIRETAELLNIDALQKAVDLLKHARRIHFIGVGASSIIAQDAEQKFLRINKTAYAFEDMHMAATLIANAASSDVVIGISFSGETPEVASLMQLANQNGVPTISLTKYGKWAVTEAADINLYTSSTTEPTFRSGATSSRMAQLQVIDILFMCVASSQYEDTVQYLDATREAVGELKLQREKKQAYQKRKTK
ncbi:MurR/RpiR family transcriptional regulator [Gracilibacillus alcaliphilus]|uniref:MurR/RpiR family transcriptional regulator n=1 Tax=Gracilibacillus alcaliphilus TaxID=1401441 RepID=UPI0019583B8A|nr:MurR/RpiR family transcriptional regulator [Gracilibacillus alcaliphilus]MBM7676991.1 DNA-binding MurR/RpiR family transcriptional regulator [Gracilibacillus alcaliphilus]